MVMDDAQEVVTTSDEEKVERPVRLSAYGHIQRALELHEHPPLYGHRGGAQLHATLAVAEALLDINSHLCHLVGHRQDDDENGPERIN